MIEMIPVPAGWREALAWVAAPTVTPWVGALAALVAAVLASPFSWIKHFGLLLPRAVFAVAVWFAAVWLIHDITRNGLSGLPSRLGFGGGGGAGGPAAPQASVPGGPAAPNPGGAPAVTLDVRFLPDAAGPGRVRDFACEVAVTQAGGPPLTLRVLADDWAGFERQLADALRAGAAGRPAAVKIAAEPFPGKKALDLARKLARETLPGAVVEG